MPNDMVAVMQEAARAAWRRTVRREECYTRAELHARGWTNRSVREFLGAPDGFQPDPDRRYPHRDFELFLRSRVDAVEATALAWDEARRTAHRAREERERAQSQARRAELEARRTETTPPPPVPSENVADEKRPPRWNRYNAWRLYKELLEDYATKKELRDSGWTESMIARFLGEPDGRCSNPRYPSVGGAVCLYDRSRVDAAKAGDEFREYVERNRARREGARRSVATKSKKTLALAEAFETTVEVLDREELIRRACESYNGRKADWAAEHEARDMERGRYRDNYDYWLLATPDSDPAFLERICVNYLRHELTRYECGLETVHGRVGVGRAASEVRRRSYAAIAAAYPHLAEECERQLRARGTN